MDSSSKLLGMKNDPILLALGKNVSDLRKEKGLTQEQLAERAGLDSTYISGIERGVRNPSFKSLVSLAKGLGITVSDVCSGIKK